MSELEELVRSAFRQVGTPLEQVLWAEDEVDAARKRHPETDEALYSSFVLLVPTHSLMSTEFVYRSHARELLERVADGQDTRDATWAEIVGLCHDVSLMAPFHAGSVGLYFRAWTRAFPDRPLPDAVDLEHYEALYSQDIDMLETESRRKLAAPTRKATNRPTVKAV